MVDVQKQVDYWRDGATGDLRVAEKLIADNEIPQGLFFAHLSLEKLLKAHICQFTQDIAPRIHNLSRLAEICNFDLSLQQKELLEKMNLYNLQGRYPDMMFPIPSHQRAAEYLQQVKDLCEWLIKKL